MSSFLDFLLIIGLSTAFSIGGLVIVRKKFSPQLLQACHEVGGVMLAVIGTLYAILIGMIVVNSQAKVEQASQMAISEANMLSSIYHVANTFEMPTRHEIREAIHDYAVIVVHQDWAKVEEGVEKEGTVPAYQKIWKEVTNYMPQNNRDQQSYSVMLGNLEELSNARKFRMVAAKTGLPPVLWAVLITGGILVIWFTYFFYMESMKAQMLLTAGVAIFLSMNVYLIHICQNPYRMEFGVKRSGFGYDFIPRWFENKNKPHPQMSGEFEEDHHDRKPQ